MKKPFTRIGSVIFGIVAVVHLLRLVLGFSMIIGGFALPLWVSFFGFLIPSALAILLWLEAGQ
jgi:hypothetical protein